MYAYNPRKKTPKQLEESLIGDDRWDILNNIIDEMVIKKGESPKQHWMLIGPRGIGKSHLITLLYYKVKDHDKLKKTWIPILFPEELRMAANLTRFLGRVSAEIYKELNQNNDKVAKDLKERLEKIKACPPNEKSDHYFSTLAWCHEKTGKRFLILIENLQQLLGKKLNRVEQKKLRSFLQSDDSLLIIGSATTIFDAIHDHSHPFYHFFHTKRLNELDFQDMKKLITSILSESEENELIKKIHENEARIKTLYSFTGGNPRMAVFLSDILKSENPDEMIDFMDNILDQLTPYFESILNDTPFYLEEIINTLASFEPAQSPKEIAAYLEVPQPTTRNYLKQLKDTGYTKIAFSKGNSNYYCLTEYLYRIWYQMRDSSHREETRWLMEMLLILYSPQEIKEKQKELIRNDINENGVSPYKKYFIQAAEFMENNPYFCQVIEMCMDSILKTEGEDKELEEETELLEKLLSKFNESQYEEALSLCKEILALYPKSEYAYIFWGASLCRQKKYDEAINKLKKAIKINQNLEYAYWEWGTCLREQRNFKKAIDKYKKAIEINPELPSAYGALGDCYRGLGQIELAEQQYEKAIKIDVRYEDAYFAWGDLLVSEKSYEKAISKYQQYIEINPKSVDAFVSIANCYTLLKKYNEAGKYYKDAVELDNKDAGTYINWGHSLREQEDYEQAIKKFVRAIDINPEIGDAYWGWGACLRETEKYEEAINKFKKAIEIDPSSFPSYGAMGDCYRALGQNELAEKQYKKAIEINDNYEDAYHAWAEHLIKQGRYDEAMQKINKVLIINPESLYAYFNWGDLLKSEKKYKEAIAKYRKATEIDSKFYLTYVDMGNCYRELKKYDLAEKQYKKAIELNDQYEIAYYNWGAILGLQEHFEESIEKFKRAVEINPKKEQAYYLWALSLYSLNRNDEALSIFNEHLMESKDTDVLHLHGDLLVHIKDYKKAEEIFQKAIAIDPYDKDIHESYGELHEKTNKKELAILEYLKYIKLSLNTPLNNLNFQKIYEEKIKTLLKETTPGKYIEQFYSQKKERLLSKIQISVFLILLSKYDTVAEYMNENISIYMNEEESEKYDFDLLIFTIKLNIWLKLCSGHINEVLSLTTLYGKYVQAIKNNKEKEKELFNFSINLFKIQINSNIRPENTLKVFKQLQKNNNVPFANLIFKIWTCLSEPDSVDAQRYLNEKAISELIGEIKKNTSNLKIECFSEIDNINK